MNRLAQLFGLRLERVPRTRGDEPAVARSGFFAIMRSPHTRG